MYERVRVLKATIDSMSEFEMEVDTANLTPPLPQRYTRELTDSPAEPKGKSIEVMMDF